jgi:hypothetical protein
MIFSQILKVIHDDFLIILMQNWTEGKWRRVLIQTSAIIANCRDSFEMNRALPGLYRDQP